MTTFAERLRQLRTEAGLTVPQLAMRCGLTASCIFAWERGTASPTLASLQGLQPREYASDDFREKWERIGSGLAIETSTENTTDEPAPDDDLEPR